MKARNHEKLTRVLVVGILALNILFGLLYFASAAPQGASVVGTPVVDSGPTRSPDGRNDTGGRIITLNLNLEQQNANWKAYVGNVTGTLVLQNSNNRSIYEWPAISTASGELYISRSGSLSFTSVACANVANITNEETFFGMSGSDTDSINRTFNATAHQSFSVGTTPIANDTCRATATWLNDTQQQQAKTATWQEVLLSDSSNLVYAAILNDNKNGYDNVSLFDFQAIVAENDTSTSGTTYYFYLELGT